VHFSCAGKTELYRCSLASVLHFAALCVSDTERRMKNLERIIATCPQFEAMHISYIALTYLKYEDKSESVCCFDATLGSLS
jgi:hypothetical protein